MNPGELAAIRKRAQEPTHERAHRIGLEDYAYEANHDRIDLLVYIAELERRATGERRVIRRLRRWWRAREQAAYVKAQREYMQAVRDYQR